MTNGANRPTGTARKAVAAALGAIALFILAYGAGMASWPVVLVGLVLLAACGGLLLSNGLRGGERAWIPATGHVITATAPPTHQAEYGRVELELVLTAPSLPTTAVKVIDSRAPLIRWPRPGSSLPVLVAVDDRRHVRIQWDDVDAHGGPPAHHDLDDNDLDYGQPDLPAPGVGFEARPDVAHIPAARRPDDPTAGTSTNAPPAQEQQHSDAAGVPVGATISPATIVDLSPPPGGATSVAGAVHGVGMTLTVSDLERSLAFYRDMLGFAIIDRGGDAAILVSGDTILVLRSAPGQPQVTLRTVHINLDVGDLAASHTALRAAGVRFISGPRVVGEGDRLRLWAATFRDPDGHGVALTEWRAVSADQGAADTHEVPPDNAEDDAEHAQRPVQ
ncbi:VOC family protein [Pilimelia columellifera]|uniref:VOC domain-containing protein n=1 Tax=Pilimelia columellifera subsp. columellifera TaxID=706583 RepID=A0ABP6AZ16_9ACTN